MRVTDFEENETREGISSRRRGKKNVAHREEADRERLVGLTCSAERHAGPPAETMHEKVLRMIDLVSESLIKNSHKATVGDFARLLQLEKELKPHHCERLVVEWVEPRPEVG